MYTKMQNSIIITLCNIIIIYTFLFCLKQKNYQKFYVILTCCSIVMYNCINDLFTVVFLDQKKFCREIQSPILVSMYLFIFFVRDKYHRSDKKTIVNKVAHSWVTRSYLEKEKKKKKTLGTPEKNCFLATRLEYSSCCVDLIFLYRYAITCEAAWFISIIHFADMVNQSNSPLLWVFDNESLKIFLEFEMSKRRGGLDWLATGISRLYSFIFGYYFWWYLTFMYPFPFWKCQSFLLYHSKTSKRRLNVSMASKYDSIVFIN